MLSRKAPRVSHANRLYYGDNLDVLALAAVILCGHLRDAAPDDEATHDP